jgi:endonuclease III
MRTSKLANEGIRVVSPDTAMRPVVLFDSANETDNVPIISNTSICDDFAEATKSPTSRKRKSEVDIVIDKPLGESLETTTVHNEAKSPRPKRKTSLQNTDHVKVSTPETTKHITSAIVTPSEGDVSDVKPLKKNGNDIPAPKDWFDIYNLVKELRQDRTAPCDHSGCEALPDKNVDHITRRFQVFMCLMLSSQTKDAVVGAAIRTMQTDNVLNIHSIHQMDPVTLDRYIQKVGFHNNKTKFIKEAVQILMDKYSGDIPRTASEMIQDLPGIGPKMAYIIESVAWGTQSGIGVDTHMHRIFNELHWVNKTNNPEKTRLQLESWLPQEYWSEVNIVWVGFGQEVQQQKPKILRKALACSRPKDALQLLKRCGLDYRKVGKELDIMDEIDAVLRDGI